MKQPDRSLAEALNPFFESCGFKFVKSRGVYIRKTASGFDDFSWSSYPLATGPKCTTGYHEGGYGLGLRHDSVEELTHNAMPIYGADNQRYAFTVYRGVGAIGGYFAFDPSRDCELCLRFDHLEEDVAETARRIEAMLEADGLAWYERYTNPATLSRDLNDPVGFGPPHPLMNNDQQRPLLGVAAACVGEPERVSALIDSWLAVARGWDEQFAHERAPLADDFAKKFALITDKARELGYGV